ncbi:hypothetical protein PoB_005134400 [Plakobranchus ocellatus]|uniref:Uncharacterized protein n=1 Tax=Plakobranchus ocellatus TaxID=259542 RepID=A0AAV4C2E6_9GAST|nr:hypothetical protein PoB_005134400 [Plakobranchus ocellatus]
MTVMAIKSASDHFLVKTCRVKNGHATHSPLCEAIPQQGDLKLSGPPSGQGAGGGAQTRDRSIPADIRADSLVTVPSTLRS